MGTGTAVDTTGAGDLWASGFLFGLVNGYGLEKCGKLGSACGYEVCQVVGANIPEEGWQRIKKFGGIMAKKRMSRSRKRDLDNPDEFISFWTKLSDFAAENKVKFSCALGFVLVFIVIAASFLYFLKKSEDTAFALLQQEY